MKYKSACEDSSLGLEWRQKKSGSQSTISSEGSGNIDNFVGVDDETEERKALLTNAVIHLKQAKDQR